MQGLLGQLDSNYIVNIPQYLRQCVQSSSPLILYDSWDLPSNYCTDIVLVHVMDTLNAVINEMTFNLFKRNPDTSQYDWIQLPNMESCTSDNYLPSLYIFIGRNFIQWTESRDPNDPVKHYNMTWSNSMTQLPLASWKDLENVPLIAAARKQSTFIPRHQFIIGSINQNKVSLPLKIYKLFYILIV